MASERERENDDPADDGPDSVFVDGGFWWLINTGTVSVTNLAAFVCKDDLAIEIEAFRAPRLAPYGQIRCEPLGVSSASEQITIAVDWKLDGDWRTASFAIPVHGLRTPTTSV